jgi:hypothetical protein
MTGRKAHRAGLLIRVALLAGGVAVYVRVWRVPKLDGLRAGAPGLLVTRMGSDSGLFDLRCPSPLEVFEPIETTVCEVVAHPQDFICRRVRLGAIFESDCFEHSVLIGDGCEHGLLPTGADSPDTNSLTNAACGQSSRRAAVAKVAATFTGILRPSGRSLNDAIALEIERVEAIEPAKNPEEK